MPYAANGQLSRKPIEGGIEISEQVYKSAREDALNGKRIVVKGDKVHSYSNDKRKVYSTTDGSPLEIYVDDDMPDGYTDKARPSKHHTFENGAWVEDEQAALDEWRATASVTARQGEQQLILADLDEQVESAIDAITDTKERKLTRAWYTRAATWERNNPEFVAMGEALGLTPEQMDEYIQAAAKL